MLVFSNYFVISLLGERYSFIHVDCLMLKSISVAIPHTNSRIFFSIKVFDDELLGMSFLFIIYANVNQASISQAFLIPA